MAGLPSEGPKQYRRAMTRQPWRTDQMSGGTLAWLYLQPHEVPWSVPSAALTAIGYTVTDERQSLVDDELGACIRYLVMPGD